LPLGENLATQHGYGIGGVQKPDRDGQKEVPPAAGSDERHGRAHDEAADLMTSQS
jgi:hypothetical protein